MVFAKHLALCLEYGWLLLIIVITAPRGEAHMMSRFRPSGLRGMTTGKLGKVPDPGIQEISLSLSLAFVFS